MQTGAPKRRQAYLDAIVADIERAPALAAQYDTVYFGGGTPSWLEPHHLATIRDCIRDHLPLSADAHWTLEANPEDVSAETLAAWRFLGFSALSLGVQSFDVDELRFLGRTHTPETAATSVRAARAAGFATVSVDLIFGLPGQDPAAWRRQLECAIDLEPDHLSCYELTIHPRTRFGKQHARGALQEAPETMQAELYTLACERLGRAGYEHYEVSSYARGSENRSRHNQKYWRHAPYLGLGPAAHSFDGSERWWNHRLLRDYIRALESTGSPVAGREHLSPAGLALEAVMLGLRTRDGIDTDRVLRRTGIDLLAVNRGLLKRLEADGLVGVAGSIVRPTPRGMAVADHLATRFEVPA